jgi:hypothetical protein
MTFRTWIRKLFARKAPPLTARRRTRPRLDALEDRTLPAVLTVNSLLDNTTASDVLTLREAIQAVNAGSTAGLSTEQLAQIDQPQPLGTNDTITFAVSGTVSLNGTQLPALTHDLTITGPTAGLAVDAHGASRIFQVNAGATVGLSGLALANGSAFDGGGIVNFGTLSLTSCTLAGNAAGQDGGGIENQGGTLSLTRCALAGNSASRLGGGIASNGTLALTNCTLSGNSAGSDGGGIFGIGTLTASGCTLSGNSAASSGGGIANGGTMTLTNSTVSDNQAGFSGAGLRNDGAAMTVQGCTIANNTAPASAGVSCNTGVQSFSNSTFFHNQATGTGIATAGGVASYGGTTTIVNCTFSGNQSVSPNGGDDVWASGPLTFANSIFTGSAATADPNVAGAGVTGSLGHNLSTDASFTAAAGDQLNTDPLLAPLAANGGPTQTLALLPGSPAIDAGDTSLVPPALTTDQRGFARLSGASVDLGAFEVQQPSFSPPTLQDGTYGTPYSQAITATATGGAAGPFTFAVAAGALSPGLSLASDGTLSGTPTAAGSFSFTVQATDSDADTGSRSYTLTIDKATPVLTWASPADIVYGTALGGTQLDATANVPGTFSYNVAPGTILGVGPQTLFTTFTPADTADYQSITLATQLNVDPAVPALQAVFVGAPAAAGTQVVGPVVVFNDPVFFGRKAFQLRDRHGHTLRLQLEAFYLPTGQTVVVLGYGTGGLNWHDLVAGKYVLTIDGRQVFDGFGRGPLGGIQKVRFFPLVNDLDPGSPLAGALLAVG